jgi:hypothetical protein
MMTNASAMRRQAISHLNWMATGRKATHSGAVGDLSEGTIRRRLCPTEPRPATYLLPDKGARELPSPTIRVSAVLTLLSKIEQARSVNCATFAERQLFCACSWR